MIGDVGRGIFVRPGIPEFMRDRAVPAADIVTPNLFELAFLSGIEIRDLGDFRRAADRSRDGTAHHHGDERHLDDTPADSTDVILSTADGLLRLRTPLLPVSVNGAGDAIAALFLGKYLQDKSAQDAVNTLFPRHSGC